MINEWICKDGIQLAESFSNWEDALYQVARPLLDSEIIEHRYVDAIIKSHHEIGPYYVIHPGLAMPHARPEEGANKIGLSFLNVIQSVDFEDEEHGDVHTIIMLSAPDNNSHIGVIQSLSELFNNEKDLGKLIHAQNKNEMQLLINKY